MARVAQEITDAELAVLQLLWELSLATIRQLTDRLYPGGGASQYATVQKLLERLETKGFVHRDRAAASNVFSPAIAREEVIGRRVRSVAEKLCGGSLASLVTHLVRTQRLTTEERRSLRALIDELDKGGK
jgi:BlaI family transcriptional regulator, penicillinase repressor